MPVNPHRTGRASLAGAGGWGSGPGLCSPGDRRPSGEGVESVAFCRFVLFFFGWGGGGGGGEGSGLCTAGDRQHAGEEVERRAVWHVEPHLVGRGSRRYGLLRRR